MSRFTGLQFTGLPCLPVCFFRATPYTGVVHFFMLAEPLLLLHTPTHAAAHNTTQHAGCCGQQPALAYTPCHVRQENYANLVTALPPQNSPAAAHAEVACTAFAVILMTTRKSTASANHAPQQRSLPAVPMTTRMRPSVKREGGYPTTKRTEKTKRRDPQAAHFGATTTAGETQTRHIEVCGDTSALLVHVRAFSPVYRFALFTGSFWSCHYRPVNRDIDCMPNEWSLRLPVYLWRISRGLERRKSGTV